MHKDKSPLTARDHELLDCPPIQTYFPLVFNDKCSIEHFSGECSECRKEIHGVNFRGLITRPTDHVAVIEAVGVCFECKVLTRFLYRVYDDFRLSGIRNGKWVTWNPKRKSIFGRFISRFLKFFRLN